ncbi:MAG: pilus assembly protein PilM [Rubripirellula sp.]|nr:pilus assembly protein PilM [Rubripirellula sp.]
MSTDNVTELNSGVCCGACNATNRPDAKFCVACGRTLYGACDSCKQKVLLSQKYCESCGADLVAALGGVLQKHQKHMADALAAAKESRFDRALWLLSHVANTEDNRFVADAEKANLAIEKIKQLQATAEAESQETLAKATQAYESGNQPLAAKLLATIPEPMMTSEIKDLREKAEAFVRRLKESDQGLRAAIAEKNWRSVGCIVGQLLEFCPDDERYRQVATQVGEKLQANVKRAIAKGRYESALDTLGCVPRFAQSESFQQLTERAGTLHWLSDQVAAEPIATPMLGRLAVRFAKMLPADAAPKSLVSQLADRLKTGPRQARSHFPAWNANLEAAFGESVAVLSDPRSIALSEHAAIKSSPGRFNVAFGLAIQGLGLGRIEGHFCEKVGLLGGRSKRKNKVWGVDLGNASLKAVCLQEIEGRLTVIDAFVRDYEMPLCRKGNQASSSNLLGKAIKEFLDQKQAELRDAGIWCNLHPSGVILKTLRLPPVKDKKAIGLLNEELKQQIPIPMDELTVVRWIAGSDGDKIHGRPALAAAGRKQVVECRLAELNSLGLKVDGLQVDTLALVNFAAYEFADDWAQQPESQTEDQIPSVLLVDCGASVTNLVMVSSETQWMWSLHSGGEDCTSRIAQARQVSHAAAEKIKQNPAELTHPAEQYQAVEKHLNDSRIRIDASIADALKRNKRFLINQSYCCGGGCLSLGWMRRIMFHQS